MSYLIVSINRLLCTDFPGWVECELIDADGNQHLFHEKISIVTTDNLDDVRQYPCRGLIRCEISAFAPGGPDTKMMVNTSVIDGVTSLDGLSDFCVKWDQIL